MKTCPTCKKTLPKSNFNWRNKKKGTLYSYCKPCWNKLNKERYQKNKKYYIDKAKRNNQKYIKRNQDFISSYLKNHPCADCGEDDIVVLEFDHKDANKKTSSVSNLSTKAYSLDRVKEEVGRCVVRCANCHRKKTADESGYWRAHP